jgi:hypothetical protein
MRLAAQTEQRSRLRTERIPSSWRRRQKEAALRRLDWQAEQYVGGSLCFERRNGTGDGRKTRDIGLFGRRLAIETGKTCSFAGAEV